MFLFELYMRFNGYELKNAYNELTSLSKMNNSKLTDWKNEKKWEIFNYHLKYNSMYKNIADNNSFDNWDEIHVIEKKNFQSNFFNNLSDGYNNKDLYIANTTGSSGHPFMFAKNKYAHSISWAGVKLHYENIGVDYLAKQARFLGTPIDKKSAIKEKFKDMLMNRKRFDVYNLGDDNFSKILDEFKSTNFKYIYGYANTMLSFAKYLIKKNIILKKYCPSLSICISTSEMLFSKDRKIMSEAFGLTTYNEYGSSETSIIGIENMAGHLITSDNLLVEILDDENQPVKVGDTGKIVVTDLFNLAMPFIRYDIGDIGSLAYSEVGDRYYINQLCGRENDTIYLPSGKKSPGLTFYYISRSLLENSSLHIEQFLIRQTKLNEFCFEIKAESKLSQDQMLMVKDEVSKYLEPNLEIIFSYPEKIENISKGKIKHFFSEL